MITPQNERHALELAVIGYVLAHAWRKPYLPTDMLSVCPPKAFTYPATRGIAEAVAEISAAGKDCDSVNVTAALRSSGKLREIGGAGVIASLLTGHDTAIISDTGLMLAAQSVAAERRKDDAQSEIAALVRQVQTPGVTPEQISEGLRGVAAMLEGEEGEISVSLDQQLDEYLAAIDSPERQMRPTRTPWRGVNAILRGGILPTELAIVAARPGVGKSAFALNLAYSVACSGSQALFFSLEMARQQLLDRLVANVGSIDLGRFREGLSVIERGRARDAAEQMRGKSLLVYDDTRITVGEIRRRVRIAQRGGPVGLVVVDYLQLMTPDDRKLPREQQVAQMSRDLKLLAKNLCVPVVLLAQLNRKSEEAKRDPMLSDLRESGAIEQDADIVIFLHQARQAWHSDEPVRVIVAKGRSSGVGREHLVFQRKFQRFMDSDEAAYSGAVQQEEKETVRHWQEAEQGNFW